MERDLDLPALGRSFQLGMLYDATTDKLIQGQELWDKDAIQNAQKDTPYIDMQLKVISDDFLATKSKYLGVTGSIKMNLLAGLVNVSGAAEYYNDHKSTRQVVRVPMHLKFLSHKQKVDIQQLGPVKDPAIISATRATHVVSGILFGLEAFLIIDRPYSVDEESQIAVIQDKATACAHLLEAMYQTGKTDINARIDQIEASTYKFKLHCDFSLPAGSSLSNLEEAKTFLIDQFFPLIANLGKGNKCISLVPKKIWLYSLAELCDSVAFVDQSISSNSIINQIEEISEKLIESKQWINNIFEISNAEICSRIQCFRQQLTRFLQLIKHFQSGFKQQLSDIIPNIRNGLATNDKLLSLLKQIADSPFSSDKLTLLLSEFEQEIHAVALCLKSITSSESVKVVTADDLESLCYDYSNVLCFEIRVGGSHKAILDQMDEYLHTKNISNNPHSKVIPWYKDIGTKRAIQQKAKTFKEFFQINNQNDDVKFVVLVTNRTPSCKKEGATIVLHTDENPVKFDLPSKPLNVRANYSAKNEVTLNWSKPKLGADNILSYRVCHHLVTNPPNEWIFTITPDMIESQILTQLNSNQIYEFGVQAKCKVGYSATSEVIRLKIPLEPETFPMTTPFENTPKLESASNLDSLSHVPEKSASALNSDQDADISNSGYHTPPEIASTEQVSSTDTSQKEQEEWRVPENPCLMPITHNLTHNSVELKWEPPDTAVEKYTVYYHEHNLEDPDNNAKEFTIDGQENHCFINGLTHDTRYAYKLCAKLSTGVVVESDGTDIITTPSYLPLKIQSESILLAEKTKEQPAIYKLKQQETIKNTEKKLAKYKVGQPILYESQKVLMLVGATGAGKTTLINGIANYMYGVQWDDDFRFVLIENETKKSQAHSQTSWITAYTLHRAPDSPIPYSLTIIDTPGFGDTEGIERDKKIVNQIKDFFAIKPPNGIDILHGIGFVVQASLARLSYSQRYIFDSILSIYGRDVASNIFLMTTFADGQSPPVLEAIKVAKVPYKTYSKFNNSALFVRGHEDGFDSIFWKMGVNSFKNFFLAFDKAEPRSLQLTREVLDEREQLENVLKELQPQIRAGLIKMDELQYVVSILQKNKASIEENKDFNFKINVTKQKKVDMPPGQYTTNCLKCNYTCHEDCKIAEDCRKRECCAMNKNGNCTVCPYKCIWSSHVNNPYIFKLYEEEENRTSAELKERYDTAKEGESRAEIMISNIKDKLEYLENSILIMVDSARKSLMRLDEIALKPNPLSEVEYIDKLIASEELQMEPGYLERVNAYKQLRKKAELLQQIKTHDPTSAGKNTQGPILDIFGNSATYNRATMNVLNENKKPAKQGYGCSWLPWNRKSKTNI